MSAAIKEFRDDEDDLGEIVTPGMRQDAPPPPSGDAPKRRGRPRKAAPEIDGTEHAPPGADDATSAAEKPRKRKAGKADPASVDKLTQFIGAAHMIIATQTGAPELLLEEKEARSLATALTELSSQYGYSISPKAAALASVGMVSVSIYAPRMFAIAQRVAEQRKREAAARPAPAPRPATQAAQPGPRPQPQNTGQPRAPANAPPDSATPGPHVDPVALYGDPAPSEQNVVDL